jgi:anion-transporting ATPase
VSASAIEPMLARPFQVVAGKGGVGRTVVASALALRASRQGMRTLLLEVNAPDNAAQALGVPASVDEPRKVLDDLWLCRMTPRGSLREYALMVLKFKALYNLVFENRLVKYLLRSIPSLAEFTMLGKVWYHSEERLSDGSPRYERIIVDAPATGHAITFLSVARTVADIVPKGIMQEASEKMAELIESKERSCLHIVCLPEEMPVNEALDIAKASTRRLRMTPGVGVVNRMLPPLVEKEDEREFARLEAKAVGDEDLARFVTAAKRRLDREAWQAGYAERFARESRMPTMLLPDLGPTTPDRKWIEALAGEIDRAAGTRPSRKAIDG